jgi:hypothetical protein
VKKLLSKKKKEILRRWRNEIFSTYASETSRFLQEEKNRFGNPVGYAIHHGTEVIFHGICEGHSAEELSPALDEIIRIRAVQDFAPAEAVAFISQLKKAVREELEKEIRELGKEEAMAALESRIDTLARKGADIYQTCRQKIDDIKLEQGREQGFRPIKRRKR